MALTRRFSTTRHRPGPPGTDSIPLERACRRLDLPASGTAVHAHLRPAADGYWHLKWSNAGHPAPLLVTADGIVGSLTQHDVLLHHVLPPVPRTCAGRSMAPGSTLLLPQPRRFTEGQGGVWPYARACLTGAVVVQCTRRLPVSVGQEAGEGAVPAEIWGRRP